MRTIIAGSRTIWDFELVDRAVDECGWEISEVVCGMAPGIDTVGWAWAWLNRIPIIEVPADWMKHGKAAGPLRNEEMAAMSQALICCWDGESRGSRDMIRRAHVWDLRVHVKIVDLNPFG